MPGVTTRPPRGRLSDESPPPTPRDPGGGGGGGEWTLLTIAANQVVAYLIQGRLAQEGIDVVLDASNASPAAWLHPFGDPSSPVKIFVRRSDLTAASLLLHEVDQPVPGATPPPPRERRYGTPAQMPFRVLVALAAALTIAGLLVVGPCVSHWFCV